MNLYIGEAVRKSEVVADATSPQFPQNYPLARVPSVAKDERAVLENAAARLQQTANVDGHEGTVGESDVYRCPVWEVSKDMVSTPGEHLIGVVWKMRDGADNHGSKDGVVMRKRATK